MTLFQVRYLGAAAPEPETVAATDADEAVRAARRRLEASGAHDAVVSRDGVIVRRVSGPAAGAAGLERRLIEAGVYVFAPPTRA